MSECTVNIWQNKRVIVGLCGGIAAYKACEIVRRLRERGAQVRVVMSRGAQAFITPLTLQALSGEPVHTDLLDPAAEGAMGHIELARWADAILIAPASADHLAKVAAGIADELLTTLLLATTAPVFFAPAMNQQMYSQAVTQENLQRLGARGYQILGPASGDQACGEVGPGRMLEALELVQALENYFARNKGLAGLRVVITAGPTREAIDPVRYLSNHSSGKMGYALAQAAQEAGADVVLISGPAFVPTPMSVTRIDVESAQQMLTAVEQQIACADVFIACAAVADYQAQYIAPQKIKKQNEQMTLVLSKTPDILARIASRNPRPFCVGFAAETEQVEAHARSKLQRKQLDMICANDVSQTDVGFGSDDNALQLFYADGRDGQLPRQNKLSLARALIEQIAQALAQRVPGASPE